MSTTDKNRNLLRRLGSAGPAVRLRRPGPRGPAGEPPAPIDLGVRDEMVREASASLDRLRERILAG